VDPTSGVGLWQLVVDGLKELLLYFNPMLAVIAAALTEILKPIVEWVLPDKLESLLLATFSRILAISISTFFGFYAMHLNFLTSFTTGVLICGGYLLAFKFIDRFSNGRSNGTTVPPSVPK
jgi:hypothetical protein